MPNTVFPFESPTPEMQVTLPVGTHVLELVVIDSGGVQSPPVTVIVIVEPDTAQGPIIEDFRPKWLGLGTQVDPFVIKGWRLRSENEKDQELEDKTRVEFLYEDKSEPDPMIQARIRPEKSTTDTLELVITVSPNCTEGKRRLQVIRPSGNHVADEMIVVKKQ